MTDASPHDTGEHVVLQPEVVGSSGRDDVFKNMAAIDGTAILAFVLAISSWFILPVVGAIAALVIAPGAKRRIRRSDGALTGASLVTSAQIISWLNLVLGILIVWAIVALLRWAF